MKHLKVILGGLLLAMVPVFALVSVTHAQRFATTVDEDQKVYSSLYSSGKTVDIHGEIFGDVFCAGQDITIDATFHGDIICAGQDITIAGRVDGDVRVAGQVVSISAAITRSATVAALNFSLDADASVGQDLTANGGELNIKGGVARDVTVGGTALILNGKIGRNVTAESNKITLKDNAAILGNLTYTGTAKPERAGGAEVLGKTTEMAARQADKNGLFSPIIYLFALSSLVLIGLLLALVFPRYMERTSAVVRSNLPRTMLIGAVASIVAPILMFAFAFTLVGIPLALLLLVAFTLAAMLSGPIVAYAIGQRIMRTSKSPVTIALVGGVLLVTAYFIPFVGLVFLLGALWLGLGALITDLQVHIGSASHTKAKAAK